MHTQVYREMQLNGKDCGPYKPVYPDDCDVHKQNCRCANKPPASQHPQQQLTVRRRRDLRRPAGWLAIKANRVRNYWNASYWRAHQLGPLPTRRRLLIASTNTANTIIIVSSVAGLFSSLNAAFLAFSDFSSSFAQVTKKKLHGCSALMKPSKSASCCYIQVLHFHQTRSFDTRYSSRFDSSRYFLDNNNKTSATA